MKTPILMTIAACIIAGFSCTPSVDVEKEKAAIIAVIEEETNGFYARSLDRMNAVYPADGDVTHLNASVWGYGYSTEWDGGEAFREMFEENPDPVENTEEKKNWRIRVYPGAAWASYDNEVHDEDGEVIESSKHDQFLEKQDGAWKIVYMSILRTTGFDRSAENFETSNVYHELNPENVEDILADDFVGHFNKEFDWDREAHHNFISTNTTMQDTITYQFSRGNWVATAFHRIGTLNGQEVKADVMQLKRFEDGKIAEIFEYVDPGQWED